LEEEVNNSIIESIERQPAKKRPNVLASAVFFGCKINFQKR
jgi:hypothetical protein